MEPLKVTYVINSLGMGGAERFLIDLILNLDRRHVMPQVLCLYREGEWARQLQEAGVQVEVLKIPKGKKGLLKGYRFVLRALQKQRPDVIHSFLEGNWYGMPAGWFCRVPVRVNSLQNCYRYWSLKLRIFDRLMFQFAHCGIACSRAVARFFIHEVWYPPRKVQIIYNGVDPSRFWGLPKKTDARRTLGLPQDRILVTTVASLTPQKGHSTLLQALRWVTAEYSHVMAIFVGDGELRPELEQQSEKLGLKSYVLFMGKSDNVPAILAASDIFALPSLWEGFGIALIEAWMAGLPVVASRVDGIAEIVDDRRNGILVPPGEVESLASALLELIKDSEQRIVIGQKGHETALERFTIQKIARQFLTLYERFMSGEGE